MKTYMIFSKKNIDQNVTVLDASGVKVIKYGFMLGYSLEVFSIFYGITRGQYYFSLIIASTLVLSAILGNFILFGMLSLCFGIIGSDAEVFFIKLKGYKLRAAISAKNENDARLQFFSTLS